MSLNIQQVHAILISLKCNLKECKQLTNGLSVYDGDYSDEDIEDLNELLEPLYEGIGDAIDQVDRIAGKCRQVIEENKLND